jgi:prolyl-tRNA synthetase
MGVKNCSFPLFVTEDVLQREKDHIEGFAAEVAWVTHAYGFATLSNYWRHRLLT